MQLGSGVAMADRFLGYIEPRLTLAVNEILAVDANFYVLLDDDTLKYDDPNFMGSMGLHVRWIQRTGSGWRGELVLGPAVGRGGELRFPDPYPPPSHKNPVAEQFAFGGFAGGNLAYRFNRKLAVFLGSRLDLVQAAPNPRTRWLGHMVGIEAELSSRMFMSAELALLLSRNELQEEGALAACISLGGRWGE